MSDPTPVARYRLAWDPIARRGGAAFAVEGGQVLSIPALGADEFSALSAMLNHPDVGWDGRHLWAGKGKWPSGTAALQEHFDLSAVLLEVSPSAQRVLDECESEWPANKSDCSGFVKDVAAQFGVSLKGLANDIVDALHGSGWSALADGRAAKDQADAGKLVVGGLRGDQQEEPSEHGHVVVVVSGPLAKGLYPTAYWGSLGGTGERSKTVNWAWKAADRDKVFYASHDI